MVFLNLGLKGFVIRAIENNELSIICHIIHAYVLKSIHIALNLSDNISVFTCRYTLILFLASITSWFFFEYSKQFRVLLHNYTLMEY